MFAMKLEQREREPCGYWAGWCEASIPGRGDSEYKGSGQEGEDNLVIWELEEARVAGARDESRGPQRS